MYCIYGKLCKTVLKMQVLRVEFSIEQRLTVQSAHEIKIFNELHVQISHTTLFVYYVLLKENQSFDFSYQFERKEVNKSGFEQSVFTKYIQAI